MLCDYEIERQKRIEANQRRMRELVNPLPMPHDDAPASRGRSAKPSAAPKDSQERRVSSRLLGVDAPSYKEAEHADSPKPKRIRTTAERGEYGVEGAESCHSCRQKTTSLKARCTKCPILWCVACLRVRYGEDAASANATGEWRCGRCRGTCLCSACRRKAGKKPTGVLGPTAAAHGYASVLDLLSD